jgi:preprotein translocase subunit SecY
MPETMLRRISITLGAVLIYRAGLYIPLPGINPALWDTIFRTDLGPLFTSGGIHRLSIFGIGIFSYIAAAVVPQLATVVSPRLASTYVLFPKKSPAPSVPVRISVRQQGWRGRQIVVRRTRYLTTLFATFQACALAFALNKANVASDPGLPFIISTAAPASRMPRSLRDCLSVRKPENSQRARNPVRHPPTLPVQNPRIAVTLTGGTMFLVWLSEQITSRGVGNGIAVILFANLVAEFPHDPPSLT